jgi:hypothetical protein
MMLIARQEPARSNRFAKRPLTAWVLAATCCLAAPVARADAVTDWNVTVCDMVVDGKTGAPVANHVLAMTNTAAYEAANAITRRYPAVGRGLEAPSGASVDAAIAAANHVILTKLLPLQQAAADAAYQKALSPIAESAAKTDGIAVGRAAAAAVLLLQGEGAVATAETYRPHTTPGAYVPTTSPAALQWPQHTPWFMNNVAQFRPGPPPLLTSAVWARDYNESKALGGKNSTRRSPEQTEIARFWETTMPPVYHGLVRSVSTLPGRDVTQNARLYAAVARASDDALIAVFDAKYHYGFWRPVTAIRNGDMDGNDATERDAAWSPYIETPMHPEYPCAHCIIAATVGTVLQAEIGAGAMPVLTTTSATAKGAARRWTTMEDFMQEVANARVYDGVHYRNSTEVGMAMGKQIGALAAEKYLRKPQ